VTNALADFLPAPTVEFDGEKYYLDYDRPHSIGKIASFYGVAANFVRAYAWIMAHGAEGLQEVARIATLNNNYLTKKILEIPGLSAPYAEGQHRVEQTRYSWHKLIRETGLTITEISSRSVDFAMHFFYSHHPYVVEDPATLEPTESYSQRDMDEYAAAWVRIADEARHQPEIVRSAPHHAPIHQMTCEHEFLADPAKWSPTWRAFRRKHPNGFTGE
jgi:glycine dehydrogenase subunit 2